MKTYYKFRNSCLDTMPVGFYTGKDESDSVYTPARARMVAWCGNAGVHLCQVEGFGGMIFAVDPTAPPGDCIHPIAGSIVELVGLIIQCKHIGPILSAYQWSRELFNQRCQAIKPDFKTRSVLRALENTYCPPRISDPYNYIAALQDNFDYASLPLHKEYFEWCPIRPGTLSWDVGYGTAFADYCEKDKVGQELPVNRSTMWAGESWTVPAIYLCENGIVVDSYLEVSGAKMSAFRNKWANRIEDHLSIEDQMFRKLDDPLGIDVTGTLAVNDLVAPLRKSFTLIWNPLEENDWHSRRTLEHYGLDRNKGYLLRRECFRRKGKNPPIEYLNYALQAAPAAVPGQRFLAPRPGESLTFTDPSTGTEHTLTVVAQTREALHPNFLSNHPCCYTRLSFSLEPQIAPELFSVVDCDAGDPYEQSSETGSHPYLPGKVPSAGHSAVSSLRHQPAESITWRMIFRYKTRQDLFIPLLP